MIDSQGRREVLDVLARVRAEGSGILLITHDVAEAAHADRVLVLSGGRAVFAGTPAELLGARRARGSWGLELPPLMRARARRCASSACLGAGTPQSARRACGGAVALRLDNVGFTYARQGCRRA